VEQQLATRASERQIAKLVEHHELVAAQLGGKRAGLPDPRLLPELCHQLDGVAAATTAPARMTLAAIALESRVLKDPVGYRSGTGSTEHRFANAGRTPVRPASG
jgi:hypothetical protein